MAKSYIECLTIFASNQPLMFDICLMLTMTISCSDVAKISGPRDALSPPVVSFNSTKRRVVVEFYLYPTVGTVLIHSVKPELTE